MVSRAIYEMSFAEYADRVQSLTENVLIANERRMEDSGCVPDDVMTQIKESGLFGITIPREYGGLGWSMEEQVLLTQCFTRASCVYRSRISTTIGLSSQVILDHGSESQRKQFLPDMAAGNCVAAFALTEPGAGSDASNVATTATYRNGRWSISGAKRFITNGAWADLFVVAARTEGVSAEGLSLFLVDAHNPGVEASAASRMNGHEAGPVAVVTFADVNVPEDALVGDVPGDGLKKALRGINHARLHVAATGVGQSLRLIQEMTEHALERQQFGKPLADLEVIQGLIGRALAETLSARAMVFECARIFDTGTIPHHSIAAAKLVSTETAFRVADTAVQILGGEGIVGDSPVPRMWRDVRALRIYEGASQIHERNLGRHVIQAVRGGQDLAAAAG